MFLRNAKHNVGTRFDASIEITDNQALCLAQMMKDEDRVMRNTIESAYPYVSDKDSHVWTLYDMKNSEFWQLVEAGWLIPLLEGDGNDYVLTHEAQTAWAAFKKVFENL